MDYANMKLTDSTSSYTPPEPRCEQCKHYGFIDSGYGYCRRYPPKLTKIKFRKWDIVYPETAWCEYACGEFSEKT